MNDSPTGADREQTRGADCVIVGAGASGLAAAVRLANAGYTVQVLEAASTPGGRVRGALYQGEPADIGFQTILRGYPAVSDFLTEIDVGSSDLHTFERRIVIHDGTKWRKLKVLGPGSIVTSGLLNRSDIARAARLAGRAAIGGARELDSGNDQTAEQMFREAGLSDRMVDMVLRPLVGSMVLDRSLQADAGYVRFLLGMMARGPAVLPVDGIGMIIDRATSTLGRAGGMIFTDTPVAAVTLNEQGRAVGVQLRDGRTITAKTVVLAVGAAPARQLLSGIDDEAAGRVPTEMAGCVSASFALDRPLYREATILLDAAAPEGTDRVDLVCQTTNVTRPGSPGPHVLVAQSATSEWSDVDPQRYARRVRERLSELIPNYRWHDGVTLIDATDHPSALYRLNPGLRAGLPGPRTAVENLVLAGDITTHPSLEGAVSAGTRAADIVADLLA